MNKDQEVLETKFKADGVQNIITKDGTVYSSVLSAMEQQAVAFAEWIKKEGYYEKDGLWAKSPNTIDSLIDTVNGTQQKFTTSELYQIFNQQN
jgi:hypothetical protein